MSDIKADLSDKDKLMISTSFNVNPNVLWSYLTEPHKMRLWIANQVEKTPQGYFFQIDFPLYAFQLDVTIVEEQEPELIKWIWNSEYVMDESMVRLKLEKINGKTNLKIVEIGPFSDSRWSQPREIHADLWEKAIGRLKNILQE